MKNLDHFSFIPVPVTKYQEIEFQEVMYNSPYDMPLDGIHNEDQFWDRVDIDCESIKGRISFIIPVWDFMTELYIPNCLRYPVIPYRDARIMSDLLLFISSTNHLTSISQSSVRECYDQYIEKFYDSGDLGIGEKVGDENCNAMRYTEFSNSLKQVNYTTSLSAIPPSGAICLHEFDGVTTCDIEKLDTILSTCDVGDYFDTDKFGEVCEKRLRESEATIFEANGKYYTLS